MIKLMLKEEAEKCIFDDIIITDKNLDKFDEILKLPYQTYVQVINKICNGEATINDFSSMLFDSEVAVSSKASLEDINVDKISHNNVAIKYDPELGVKGNLINSLALSKLNTQFPVLDNIILPLNTSVIKNDIITNLSEKLGIDLSNDIFVKEHKDELITSGASNILFSTNLSNNEIELLELKRKRDIIYNDYTSTFDSDTSYTFDSVDNDGDITYTSLNHDLRNIEIAHINPEEANEPLNIIVLSHTVLISLATDSSGKVVSKAYEVADAINSTPDVSSFLMASYEGDGSGVVKIHIDPVKLTFNEYNTRKSCKNIYLTKLREVDKKIKLLERK